MTLAQIKPKNFSIWILGLFMLFIPMNYLTDMQFGISSIRISQEQFYQVLAIGLFSIFILQNVYLSLFLLWSLFLYFYYSFPSPSGVILLSIVSSCMIYEATYRIVDKDNVKLVFNFVICFAVFNLVYMMLQSWGFELLFKEWTGTDYQNSMLGFFGLKAISGMFFAMALAIYAYESPIFSLGFFVPIYFSECSSAMVAGVVSYLFNLYHLSRKMFWASVIILGIGASAYAIHDSQARMFTDRAEMWKVVMRDALKRPFVGFGMDSFRSITPNKQVMYWKNVRTLKTGRVDVKDTLEFNHTGKYDYNKYSGFMKEGDVIDPWDNPHNEYIQLFYEFGVIPFFILGFLIWDMKRRFISFDSNHIRLIAFFIGILIISIGQFPFHLARIGLFIPVMLGVYYKLTEKEEIPNVG